MKVLVAGATGALGSRVIGQLIARDHEVVGLTRDANKARGLEENGCRAEIADVLDAEGARRAVETMAPDAILQVLNALPKGGPRSYKDLEATNRLRTQGTSNLLEAARVAGVERFVAENFFGTYGYKRPRGHVVEEDEPILRRVASPELQPAIEAMAFLDERVREVGGVVLRCGAFYGPTVASTKAMVKLLRRRMMPIIGPGNGRVPWIHIDDAASACVDALETGEPGGAYNICDDEPVEMGVLTRVAAEALGAPRPIRIPRAIARLGGAYLTRFFETDIVLSNGKAKREIGWKPAFPSYLQGWAHVARSL